MGALTKVPQLIFPIVYVEKLNYDRQESEYVKSDAIESEYVSWRVSDDEKGMAWMGETSSASETTTSVSIL